MKFCKWAHNIDYQGHEKCIHPSVAPFVIDFVSGAESQKTKFCRTARDERTTETSEAITEYKQTLLCRKLKQDRIKILIHAANQLGSDSQARQKLLEMVRDEPK